MPFGERSSSGICGASQLLRPRRRRQRKGRRYRPPPAYSRMARSERFTTAIVAWKSYKRPGLCNFQASESWVELGTILRFHFTNGFATSLL